MRRFRRSAAAPSRHGSGRDDGQRLYGIPQLVEM
jgi:hypothetical protein